MPRQVRLDDIAEALVLAEQEARGGSLSKAANRLLRASAAKPRVVVTGGTSATNVDVEAMIMAEAQPAVALPVFEPKGNYALTVEPVSIGSADLGKVAVGGDDPPSRPNRRSRGEAR